MSEEKQRCGDTTDSERIFVKVKERQVGGWRIVEEEITTSKEKCGDPTNGQKIFIKVDRSERQKDRDIVIKEVCIEDLLERAKRRDEINHGAEETSQVQSKASTQSEKDLYRYNMDYPCVGRCLIINNETFRSYTEEKTRYGTDKDAAAVREIFESLGYKVEENKDCTAKEMINLLKKESERDHSENASFVCVILTHGDKDEVCGVDEPVKLDILTKCFKGNNCRSLLEKPKLFFIQACRGSKLDDGVEYRDMADSDDLSSTSKKIPLEADFLYAYASPPGFVSWRDNRDGSWFIQSLCETIRTDRHLELMHILTRVNRKVAYEKETFNCREPKLCGKKEIPCIVSMLTKEFYFPQ